METDLAVTFPDAVTAEAPLMPDMTTFAPDPGTPAGYQFDGTS